MSRVNYKDLLCFLRLRFGVKGYSIAIVFSAVTLTVNAQFSYVLDQTIEVLDLDGKVLHTPWLGGLNAAQVNTMDLNGDNLSDVILFDRMENKLSTLINTGEGYRYAPDYERFFPDGVQNWLLLRDYNCDGLKDIFTGDDAGIKVFLNSSSGNDLSWQQYLFYSGGTWKAPVLLTTGSSGKVNLITQFDDLPSISDVDNDGDLDIFNFRYNGAGVIEFHKNLSKELYGSCDSLEFERMTQYWAGLTQCQCEAFAFHGQGCGNTSGRVKHAGGKAITALDLNSDGVQDLILSEVECQGLHTVINEGSAESPIVNAASEYPDTPVSINDFPAAFFEDVDSDGRKDLIVTPNLFTKESLEQDFEASTWFYKNEGSNTSPQFNFVKRNLFQEHMIDVGDNSVPTFTDEDGDGDLDLFIGNNSDVTGFGSIVFYKNTGTVTSPGFQYITDDYNNIKSLQLHNIKPQFVDLNTDSKADLTFLATDESNRSNLYFIPNTANKGFVGHKDIQTVSIDIASRDNHHFADINHDGVPDLLIGRFNGTLEYWKNAGTGSSPQFLLEKPAYLGLSRSFEHQGLACYADDLDSDGKEDLVLSDIYGGLSIISDFHNATDINSQVSEILLNGITNEAGPAVFGRAWPVAAKLFNSPRPAIIVGTVRGGVQILRNDDSELPFEQISLSIYPNPVPVQDGVTIDTNIPVTLQIISSQGSVISEPVLLDSASNYIRFPMLAQGLYIFRFSSGAKSTSRKVVILK